MTDLNGSKDARQKEKSDSIFEKHTSRFAHNISERVDANTIQKVSKGVIEFFDFIRLLSSLTKGKKCVANSTAPGKILQPNIGLSLNYGGTAKVSGVNDAYNQAIEKRASPVLHVVSGHYQHYYTKDGVITRYVDSYPRGSNNS